MTDSRKRVAILISGRGTNMAKLVEAAEDPSYPAEIAGVISDVPDAPGLIFAACLHKNLPLRLPSRLPPCLAFCFVHSRLQLPFVITEHDCAASHHC